MKFVFFGSSKFSIYVLEALELHKMLPGLIITTPDKPKGRKLVMTPNEVKIWAQNKGIEVIDPKSLKKEAEWVVERLERERADFFLVASYGKIIPANIFDIPKHKTLNIHPSLLPKYRGASPMISQILNDAGGPESNEGIGTTIMVIDEGMDTGPLLAQKRVEVVDWPVSSMKLEKIMADESVDLFMSIIDKWLAGEIEGKPQDHSKATLCGKIEKEDGLLDLNDNPQKNLLKIKAFAEWPRAYYFHKGKRVIVTDAKIENSELKILRVIPEGKKEMPYEDFLRGLR